MRGFWITSGRGRRVTLEAGEAPQAKVTHHLLWATLLSPLSLLLALMGPVMSMGPADPPVVRWLAATAGVCTGILAIYHADSGFDEQRSMAGANNRIWLVLAGGIGTMISMGWLLFTSLAMVNWILRF